MAQHSLADSIRQEAGHTPEANLAWLRKSQRKYRWGEAWSVILIAALIVLFAAAALTHQLDQHFLTMGPVVLATGLFNYFRTRRIVARLRAAEERLLQRLPG
ncbi:MAG: hypothetical protein ACRDNW_11940 [Trebonia sp.]